VCGLGRAVVGVSRRGVIHMITGNIKSGVGGRRKMVSVMQARYGTVKTRCVIAARERLIGTGVKRKADVRRGLLLLKSFDEPCKSFCRGELRM